MVKVDGALATLTLDRPECGNALDLSLAQRLAAAAEACTQRADIRAVALIGSGPNFCVGGDIREFSSHRNDISAYLRELTQAVHRAVLLLRSMPKPVVVGVHGAVAGAGVGLALAGDVVLAARSTRFRLAYGNLGLTPDAGATFFLPRVVGHARARELIIGGRVLSVEEAERWGLVARLSEDIALLDDVAAVGQRFAAGATTALARSKRLLEASLASSLEEQLELEAETISQTALTNDFAEGLRAFADKSTPKFGGT